MGTDDKTFDSEMRFLSDEELSFVTGGELTDDQKAACWEGVKRLKMIMRLEQFKEQSLFDDERTEYMSSIWDQVEVPRTLYDDTF